MSRIRVIFNFIKSRTEVVFFAIALLFLLLSTYNRETSINLVKSADKIESRLHSREKVMERYVKDILEMPQDEWIKFDNFPDDMVIYKYNSDTLHSWINRFSVPNDDIYKTHYWQHLNYLSNNNLYIAPFADINKNEYYLNLGSGWYLIKIFKTDDSTIITGILIQQEYPSRINNKEDGRNPKLKISDYLAIGTLGIDNGEVVFSSSGMPLFTIFQEDISYSTDFNLLMRLLAIFAATVALMIYHRKKRNLLSLIVTTISILIFTRYSSVILTNLEHLGSFLSPILYADSKLFSSFGILILYNLFLTLLVGSIYIIRRSINKRFSQSRKFIRILIICTLVILIVAYFAYIHITLRSILMNSSIMIDISKLGQIDIYTIICYLSYGCLFYGLLLLIQLIIPLIFKRNVKRFLLSIKGIIFFILLITLYISLMVKGNTLEKEYQQNYVISNKLSIERDLNLELYLCTIEEQIINDPYINIFMRMDQGALYIQRRLLSSYFYSNYYQAYNITVTTCNQGDQLIIEKGAKPVDCYSFYDEEIAKFGTQISNNSRFFFMNNYNGRIGYLGVFTLYDQSGGNKSLFIEIDSKYVRDDMGYPAQLLAYQHNEKVNLPSYYSYGKYLEGRLINFEGDYNYPVIPEENYPSGYSIATSNNYVHFVNKVSENNIVIISRARHSFWPQAISFSYIFLLYGALILFLLNRSIPKRIVDLPKKSFRKKVTILLTASMIFSLICLGAGSLILNINNIESSNQKQMEDKINNVQATLTDYCKYTARYNDINTPELLEAVARIANNTQSDINLFDPHGRLIRTTNTEIYDQYWISNRINPEAYYEIMYKHSRMCSCKEVIGGIEFTSLYAPIFNGEGRIVTIVNVPYFTDSSTMGEESASIIATMINLYAILLIIFFISGIAISNTLSKPMESISKKLGQLDITKKAEHIDYSGEDEIGQLVQAYNKMVDELDESAKRLANSEREQAWRDMARQIAHEIKNPLTPMRLSIQHLVRLKKQNIPGWEDKLEEISSSILEQIDILSNTATEFSSFAKFYYEEKQDTDLIEVLNDQITVLDSSDRIKIEFIKELQEAKIVVSKTQIIRVFINLITNAIQALEKSDDGLIRITISEIENDSSKGYRISFEDNGPGVKEINRDRLFKPNFTTKSSGTGLGLAICKNILDQSRGTIRYERSESLGGANFIVELMV